MTASTSIGLLPVERARADRLTQIIKKLRRHRFGRRAETLPIDQLELALEDAQQIEAAQAGAAEASSAAAKTAPAVQRRTTEALCRRTFPARLRS